MPRVLGNSSDYFWQVITDLQNQLYAVQTQGKGGLSTQEGEVDTAEGTTSTTYTDLATLGPSVQATCGVSGQVLLTVSAYIGIPGAASSVNAGYVGVEIDGNAPTGNLDHILHLSTSTGASDTEGLAATCSGSVVVSGLSQGNHTFKMVYEAGTSGTTTFARRFIIATPI